MAKKQTLKLTNQFNEALIDFAESWHDRGINKSTLSGGLIGIGNSYLVDSMLDVRFEGAAAMLAKAERL